MSGTGAAKKKAKKGQSQQPRLAHAPSRLEADAPPPLLRKESRAQVVPLSGLAATAALGVAPVPEEEESEQEQKYAEKEEDDMFALTDGEEEDAADYKRGGYHPVQLRDTFQGGRYRVVKKLGWGHFSTVWLVRPWLLPPPPLCILDLPPPVTMVACTD